MAYLFTSESVSEGHPDKVADQISDALLDQFLAYDEHAHCAIESFCTTGQVVIMGEVRSNEYVDLQTIARKTIKNIGYTKSEYQFDGDSCGVLTAIHEQSDDINLRRDAPGRSFLDELLVAPLHGAVPIAQMNDVSMPVGENLHLDVARPQHELFQV